MAHNDDKDTYDVKDSDTYIAEDPSSEASSDDYSEEDKPKSGKGKYIMYGGIAAVVGVLAITGVKIFGGSSSNTASSGQQAKNNTIPTTPPQSTENKSQDVSNATPAPAPISDSAPESVKAPETNPSLTMPPAQNKDQVLPDLNQKVDNGNPNEIKNVDHSASVPTAPDANSVPAAPVEQPPAPKIDNNTIPNAEKSNTGNQQPDLSGGTDTNQPDLSSSTDSQQPDNGVAPIAPITSNTNSSSNTVSTPSSSSDLNDSIKLLINKMDGLSDSVNNLNDTVKDTNSRIDNTDKKVEDLTKRVENLEKGIKTDASKTDTSTTKAVSKQNVAPVVKKKSPIVKHRRSHSYTNSVELSSGSTKKVIRKTHSKTATTTASSRLNSSYTLQSVVTNRAWIKRSDGTTSTYGVGDRMPNGKTIGSIDPDNGVFDTNGKLIIK